MAEPRENEIVESLLREIGDSSNSSKENVDLGQFFDKFIKLEDTDFQRLAMDLAVALSCVADWERAYAVIRRYRKLNAADMAALIFDMRCLYELERYSEVLALGQMAVSEKHQFLMANYLMGLSFEALGMYPQARSRLEAVVKQDPNFLDISYRMSKLQSGR
jgi:tetratricopeptide (TPR) repeat protein